MGNNVVSGIAYRRKSGFVCFQSKYRNSFPKLLKLLFICPVTFAFTIAAVENVFAMIAMKNDRYFILGLLLGLLLEIIFARMV